MKTDERGVTWYSCAETACELRKALKRAFPLVKFSVRSKTYTDGASITVRWTDGPIPLRVRKVVDPFQGANFDGMTDSKDLRPVAQYEGRPVHWGADYIFLVRDYSLTFYKAVLQEVCTKYGLNMAQVLLGPCGPYLDPTDPAILQRVGPTDIGALHFQRLNETDAIG